MSLILLLFVLPVATIIFSIALEKIFNNPVLVAAIILSIFLIVTFTVATTDFLIFAIAYAILAFVTAYLTNIITNYINNNNNNSNDDLELNTQACRTCRCQKQLIKNLRGL